MLTYGYGEAAHSTYFRMRGRSLTNLESDIADSFEYLVHIQVTGDADSGNSSVGIWNSTGINECEVVYAADHAESGHPIAKRQAL